MNIKITGSGSYIPTEIVTNKDFTKHVFLNDDGTPFPLPNEVITEKFYDITGIEERRYVTDDLQTSDIATIAAKKAIRTGTVLSAGDQRGSKIICQGLALLFGRCGQQPHQQEKCHHCGNKVGISDFPRPAMMSAMRCFVYFFDNDRSYRRDWPRHYRPRIPSKTSAKLGWLECSIPDRAASMTSGCG